MKDFEMTQEQLNVINEAYKPVKPVPIIMSKSGNNAWRNLGMELGFHYMTVRPNGKGDRFFSAEPI